MTLIGYRSANHPQQIAKRGPRSYVDDRATPPEVFRPLNERFNFTLDACATAENAKCDRFWTATENGLTQSWAGERVWCNPPYSHPNLERWLNKAWQQAADAELIVMLVPANRTEQAWWQKHVEPFRDNPDGCLRAEFLPGRIRFPAPGRSVIRPNERPPFGCCLLIWGESQAAGAAEPHIRGDECARIREAMRRYPVIGGKQYESGWNAALSRLDQVLREGEPALAKGVPLESLAPEQEDEADV